MTRAATEFVQPLSFEGVTGRPAFSDLFSVDGAAKHIALGREADVVCVAPATADFMARAAQGRADDLLTTVLLATRAPVVVCPAMNDAMYAHPQTSRPTSHGCASSGYELAGPATGPLAAGEGIGPRSPARSRRHRRARGSSARLLTPSGRTRQRVGDEWADARGR